VTLELFAHLVVGPLACNCFIVGDPETRAAIVIDPGGDLSRIWSSIEEKNLTIAAIVATHAHFDHIVAAQELRQKTEAPFYLHEGDKVLLPWMQESGQMFLGVELPPPPDVDTSPAEGDKLIAGATELEVLPTPGHSPGSISLVAPGIVFAGDTLFQGSVGRTDLPGGDSQTLVDSIKGKLFALSDDTVVYPGHGPATTLEIERQHNPFVGVRSGIWLPDQ
jgi:hydroxyacylglutathione hydrolase